MLSELPENLVRLGPVAWYVFVMAVTPGPNNTMLAASGLNFGLRPTVPHIFGITVGIGVLMLACGLGLGTVFATWPEAQLALAVAGSAYLLYLAWRIANAAAPEAAGGAKPLTFLEAFDFQFMNPKGWVMALTAATMMPGFSPVVAQAAVLAIGAAVISSPAMSIWAAFGVSLASVLRRPAWRRAVNWGLALLLVATIPFMFS